MIEGGGSLHGDGSLCFIHMQLLSVIHGRHSEAGGILVANGSGVQKD